MRSPPYQKHSATSQEAAQRIIESVYCKRYKVYEALLKAGERGLTDEEVQEKLGMNPSTQRPRRIELVQQNRAKDSGGWRMTRSGRRATVWVAIPPTVQAGD